MRTIVVAASKGGVGKTTLAIALATAKMASGSERVAVMDLDSFKILTRWAEVRRQSDAPPINLQRSATRLEVAIENLKERYDWLIVDTPPLPRKTIEAAVSIADLVVVPARPSPLDIGQTDLVAELCERSNKPFVFVPTLSTNAGLLAGTRAALKKKGRVSEGGMAMRDAYMTALLDGGSGNEINAAAKREIEAIWQDLDRTLDNAKRRRSKR